MKTCSATLIFLHGGQTTVAKTEDPLFYIWYSYVRAS